MDEDTALKAAGANHALGFDSLCFRLNRTKLTWFVSAGVKPRRPRFDSWSVDLMASSGSESTVARPATTTAEVHGRRRTCWSTSTRRQTTCS